MPHMYLWQASLIAITILLVSFEGMNLYLTFLRKKYPGLEDTIFLTFSSLGFLMIILIAFFGADIRQLLSQINAGVSASESLDQTVKAADTFYGATSLSVVLLMTTLNLAIICIGGVAYHDVKNRLLMTLSLRKMHDDIRKTEDDLQSLCNEQADIDSQTNSFDARFDQGLLKAQAEAEKAAQMKASQESDVQEKAQQKGTPSLVNKRFDSLIALSPIILIAIAVLVFLLSKGIAKGETIIPFDMSISTESTDYSNQQTEFQKNGIGIGTFIQNNLMPGDTLKVVGITESSFTKPYILLEGRVSFNKGSFGEVVARDKLRLLQTWQKLNLKPSAMMSDILGSLNFASNLFQSQDQQKKLIIFSDMRHYTRELDLESPKVINIEAAMKQVVKNGLVAPLAGVKIWCVGVHSVGRTPEYWKSLKAFWTEYFRQSRALEPITYSMERRILNYE